MCRRPRIPIRAAHQLLRRAVTETGDSSLGLKAGCMTNYGDGGALHYAMHSAQTVEAALNTAKRFIRLLNAELEVVLESKDEHAYVWLESPGEVPAVVEDFMMCVFFRVHMRRLLPSEEPLECHFTQVHPGNARSHHDVFEGALLRFGQPSAGFVFRQRWLSRPLPQADAKLHCILLTSLERELSEIPASPRYTDRVRTLMMNETPLRTCTLDTMAIALSTSSRTLARRLQAEDTSFGEILEQVRKARALTYLKEGRLSVEQVACTLGFSRGSAFHRAFKRWTGRTPSDHRRECRSVHA